MLSCHQNIILQCYAVDFQLLFNILSVQNPFESYALALLMNMLRPTQMSTVTIRSVMAY